MSHLHVSSLLANTASAAPSPKLVKAAHEFEGAMMKEFLSQLEPGHDSRDSDEDGQGSNAALGSFAGEALGKALSERGGFGIADHILHQLAPKSNHSGNSPVPGFPPLYPPNSPSK